MAEGGGIGPRSSEGTPAYNAGSSDQLGTLRSLQLIANSPRPLTSASSKKSWPGAFAL